MALQCSLLQQLPCIRLLESRGPLGTQSMLSHLQHLCPPCFAGLHAFVAPDVAARQAVAAVTAPATSSRQPAEQRMAVVAHAGQPNPATDVLKVLPVPSCMAAACGLAIGHALLVHGNEMVHECPAACTSISVGDHSRRPIHSVQVIPSCSCLGCTFSSLRPAHDCQT